jgi:hydroxylamine reductase (hybrid-cluster protein)
LIGTLTLNECSVRKVIFKWSASPVIKLRQRKREMQVNKTIETADGKVVFQGELSQEETDFVIGIGLNTLLKAGALPLVTNIEKVMPAHSDMNEDD